METRDRNSPFLSTISAPDNVKLCVIWPKSDETDINIFAQNIQETFLNVPFFLTFKLKAFMPVIAEKGGILETSTKYIVKTD